MLLAWGKLRKSLAKTSEWKEKKYEGKRTR